MAEFDDDAVGRISKAVLRVEKIPYDLTDRRGTDTQFTYGATVLVLVTGGFDDIMRAYPGVIVERVRPTTSSTTSSTTTSSTTSTLPPGRVSCADFPPYGTALPCWVFVEPGDVGVVSVGDTIVSARVIGVEPDGKIVTFHSAKCGAPGVVPGVSECPGVGTWTWSPGARAWTLTANTCVAPCLPPPPQFCPPANETRCVVFRTPCQRGAVAPVTCGTVTSTPCPGYCGSCASYKFVDGVGYKLVSCKCPTGCTCWGGSATALEVPPPYTGLPDPNAANFDPCGPNPTVANTFDNAGARDTKNPCAGVCTFYWDGTAWQVLRADCEPYRQDRVGVYPCGCPLPGAPTESEKCGSPRSTYCNTNDPCAPTNTTSTPPPGSCAGSCFYRWVVRASPLKSGYEYAGTTCVGCLCATPAPRGGETECSYLAVPCGPPPSTTTTTTTTTTTKPTQFFCVSPPESTYKFCVQDVVPAGYTVVGGPYSTLAACNSSCSGPSTTTTTKPPCPSCPASPAKLVVWAVAGGVWTLARNDCNVTPAAPGVSPAAWADTYGAQCQYCVSCTDVPYYYCRDAGAETYSCTSGAGGTIISGPYVNDATCGGGCGAPAIGCWQHAQSGTYSCFGANPGTGWSLVSGPYATTAACSAACHGPSSSSTTTTTTTTPPGSSTQVPGSSTQPPVSPP